MIVYKFEVNDEDNPTIYSFYSTGKKLVKKVVSMQAVTWREDVVNMVLVDEVTPGVTNSEIDTNNGDIYSVLETCSEILRHYATKHPHHYIYIKGSDERRERVYQRLLLRAVARNKEEFLILARNNTTSMDFEPIQEGVNYSGFLVIPRT